MEKPGAYKTERLIPESQLRVIVEDMVRDTLAQMLGVNATTKINRQWYDTDPAFRYLNLGTSEQLREMVRSGFLRVGHEVRDVRSPDSQIPRYQFHLEKCEAILLQLPEKRKAKKAKKTA